MNASGTNTLGTRGELSGSAAGTAVLNIAISGTAFVPRPETRHTAVAKRATAFLERASFACHAATPQVMESVLIQL